MHSFPHSRRDTHHVSRFVLLLFACYCFVVVYNIYALSDYATASIVAPRVMSFWKNSWLRVAPLFELNHDNFNK
jgi:hypothetical protein